MEFVGLLVALVKSNVDRIQDVITIRHAIAVGVPMLQDFGELGELRAVERTGVTAPQVDLLRSGGFLCDVVQISVVLRQ